MCELPRAMVVQPKSPQAASLERRVFSASPLLSLALALVLSLALALALSLLVALSAILFETLSASLSNAVAAPSHHKSASTSPSGTRKADASKSSPSSANLARDEVTVLGVIDGDTLVIRRRGKKEHLRLIGMDAPESRADKKAYKQAARTGKNLQSILSAGQAASAHMEKLVKRGDSLWLEYDHERRDDYDRVLGYAFLSDGRMLNELMIRHGYAKLLTFPRNARYLPTFQKALKEAQRERTGLWR